MAIKGAVTILHFKNVCCGSILSNAKWYKLATRAHTKRVFGHRKYLHCRVPLLIPTNLPYKLMKIKWFCQWIQP